MSVDAEKLLQMMLAQSFGNDISISIDVRVPDWRDPGRVHLFQATVSLTTASQQTQDSLMKLIHARVVDAMIDAHEMALKIPSFHAPGKGLEARE